jgi:hypothetical protein
MKDANFTSLLLHLALRNNTSNWSSKAEKEHSTMDDYCLQAPLLSANLLLFYSASSYFLLYTPFPLNFSLFLYVTSLRLPMYKQIAILSKVDCSSRVTHLLSLKCGIKAICKALEIEGYIQRIVRKKPPLIPEKHAIHLQRAQEHVNWTNEQWDQIL